MSDNKASKLVSCERPEKLCQESNDDPLNLERMSPSCSDDEEDENIPLMEVRRMALAPVKRGNDGTTVAHQAPVGNTFLRNSVGALVPTSAGVNATSGHPVPLNNDVDPRHAEKEVDMRQAHASVASAIARVAPNVGPMGYTAPPSDPVDSLWNMQHPDALHAALRRAEMITRHWLRIPPQQPASDNSSEPHPRTSFTRYTGLSEPDYGSWRNYRILNNVVRARPNPPNRPHINAGVWDHYAAQLDRMLKESSLWNDPQPVLVVSDEDAST